MDDVNNQQETDNISETSMNEYEGEIMQNFHIMRNFEMKRTRIEKQLYDNMVFLSYVDEVFAAIRSKEPLFLKAFSKPIQKDYLEWLNKLHYHGLMQEMEEDLDGSLINELDDQSCILTIDLYLSLEKKREEISEAMRNKLNDLTSDNSISQLYPKIPLSLVKPPNSQEDKTNIKSKLSLFIECEHIQNKAIFDAINEALNMYRPHSKKGEPLPWTGWHSLIVDYSRLNIEILGKVRDILLDWNSFKAGPLPWREFYHNNHFDEDNFAEFREKKLASILAYEIEKEDEERWLDYETEESQVKLDLADIVLDHLVQEVTDILSKKP